jgi:hypothetical protein
MLRLPPATRHSAALLLALFALPQFLQAETHFIEAESFAPSEGWKTNTDSLLRKASRATALSGADGPGDGVATATVTLQTAGRYRVWVRSLQVAAWRGPFDVSASAGGQALGAVAVDLEPDPAVEDWNFVWNFFDVDLPAGEVTLSLAKHEQKNCSGYVRQVDCLLLTSDLNLVPDHVPFGPQTFLRVTVGNEMAQPVYLHFFADHYRDPWYSYHSLGRQGLHDVTAVSEAELLAPGEASPWCNISPIVYQDSGVALDFSLRYTYQSMPDHMKARIEFGRADRPDRTVELVRAFEVDARPNGVVVVVPPDLDSPENVARLRRDAEFAEETGKRADAHPWPTIGKRPERIPFLVSAHIGGYDLDVDAVVTAREQKTLDYFGFNGAHERVLGGLWYMEEQSYCRPDVKQMQERVQAELVDFHKSGRSLDDIAYCILMDEPAGQSAAIMVKDEASRSAFQAWLRAQGLTPADLLVPDWDVVRPVEPAEREAFPALHYHTQRFRTMALGDFMAVQRTIIEEAYGRSFPTVVNFSDGAVYSANFYDQGIDYFELMNRDNQNALWSEDWANNASTYQCAAFNVDLMRAAARKRGQTLGHYLIAHAERTAWDTKLKATSATARGVRLWMNFSYGPTWGSHEGGPAWKSHMWYNKPENWTANAEIPREIGAVEDWLLTAKPTPANVALFYSSSSDIWSMENNAFGFDRMHTWLALSHGQVPVDVVSEMDVVEGLLSKYRVCYLSGQNLTRAATEKLAAWVQDGGTLFMTAGAATRDEYNRPLDTLEPLLAAIRDEVVIHETFNAGGRFLASLTPRDTVTWNGEGVDVLSVKQVQSPKTHATTLATFGDGSAAVVEAPAGRGRIISAGFLPALGYIRAALVARATLEKAAPDTVRLKTSYNPWDFPAGLREQILSPARRHGPTPPLTCDVPLVDAVYLPCEQGILVALANYTLEPIEHLTLRVGGVGAVKKVESVHLGDVAFERSGEDEIRVALPLVASDWLMITCGE